MSSRWPRDKIPIITGAHTARKVRRARHASCTTRSYAITSMGFPAAPRRRRSATVAEHLGLGQLVKDACETVQPALAEAAYWLAALASAFSRKDDVRTLVLHMLSARLEDRAPEQRQELLQADKPYCHLRHFSDPEVAGSFHRFVVGGRKVYSG